MRLCCPHRQQYYDPLRLLSQHRNGFHVTRLYRSFRGNFTATLKETVWLAPGVGEVKNKQTIALKAYGVTFLRASVTLELVKVEDMPGRGH